MADRDVVLLRERCRALEEVHVRHGAGGIVGVVQPEHPRARRHVGGDRLQVGQKAVLLAKWQRVRLASGEHRPDGIHRICGIRHQRHVARIDEAQCDVPDAFLRPDERQHLFRRIELYPEAAFVPVGHGLAEFREPLRFRITVVRRLLCGRGQRVDDVRRRRQVGVADAERDDVDPLRLLLRHLLADLGEQIRRQFLDAVSESHG